MKMSEQMIELHTIWSRADALCATVQRKPRKLNGWGNYGAHASELHRKSVFWAFVYVTIDAYLKMRETDAAVELLLLDAEHLKSLQKIHHAVLQAPSRALAARDLRQLENFDAHNRTIHLHAAIERMLTRSLPISERWEAPRPRGAQMGAT